jgi:hypothetical protein
MINWLLGALGFGIEQDPDFALERVLCNPGIALGKSRKLCFPKANRSLQSGAGSSLNTTDLAPQANLQQKDAWAGGTWRELVLGAAGSYPHPPFATHGCSGTEE